MVTHNKLVHIAKVKTLKVKNNNKTYISNWINFGTLNVRGINENYRIKTLVKPWAFMLMTKAFLLKIN